MFVRLLFFLWHIILFTAFGLICCLYQHIDADGTSMFVSFCLGFVANRVKGVLEYLYLGVSLTANPGGAGS